MIGLWITYQYNHEFQTLIFNVNRSQGNYNAFSILNGRLRHTSRASLLGIEGEIEKGTFIKSDDWSSFNEIVIMKKKQIIRRLFSSNPGNVNDCIKAKK